jgi:hypothetical protein
MVVLLDGLRRRGKVLSFYDLKTGFSFVRFNKSMRVKLEFIRPGVEEQQKHASGADEDGFRIMLLALKASDTRSRLNAVGFWVSC